MNFKSLRVKLGKLLLLIILKSLKVFVCQLHWFGFLLSTIKWLFLYRRLGWQGISDFISFFSFNWLSLKVFFSVDLELFFFSLFMWFFFYSSSTFKISWIFLYTSGNISRILIKNVGNLIIFGKVLTGGKLLSFKVQPVWRVEHWIINA